MASIREILQARNELYVENAVTEDDIFRVVFNRQKEIERNKADAKKNRRAPKTLTYLSRQDREAIIILTAITQSLQNMIEAWDKLGNRPTSIMKALRMAQTMVYKVIEWQFRGIPEKDYMRVLGDIAYYQIGVFEYSPVKREVGL